ncbi:MAG: hypothetical protein ABF377_13460 [Akkermansiaceae bacterium]
MSKPDDKTAEKNEVTIALLDSGSPLFLEVAGKLQLAGVASTASNCSRSSYGDRGSYAWISEIAEWIETTTK